MNEHCTLILVVGQNTNHQAETTKLAQLHLYFLCVGLWRRQIIRPNLFEKLQKKCERHCRPAAKTGPKAFS